MISAISPFMKGELPMSSPVSGLRNGAPEGRVRRQKTATQPEQSKAGETQAARLLLRQDGALLRRGSLRREIRIVGPQAGRDHAVGDEGDDHGEEQHRGEREPDIRGEADGAVGIDEMSRVVGELDEHGVERLDQHVDGKGGGHGSEAKREAGERIPSDAR